MRIPAHTKFVHQGVGVPGMFGEVIRGNWDWVDVRWRTWSATWITRHPTNDLMLGEPYRKAWTEADIQATVPRPTVVRW